MKITRTPRRVVFALAALSLVATSAYAGAADETPDGDLSVDIRANKQDYVLGETVRLTIRFTNVSGQTIEAPELPSMRNGKVRLFVSESGKEAFREYEWPGAHADVDGAGLRITPGRVLETEATILYLNRRETRHLSEPYAGEIREKYLDTDYAFMKAGTYRIKAMVLDANSESQPVTIRVHEPKGADLQVWKVLQANPDLGYLVQFGTPKSYLSTAEGAALAKTLSDLTVAYPGSRQAGDIRSSLARYKDSLKVLSRSQQEQ